MGTGYQLVVLGSVVPDPLQTLEPVPGPALRNEAMLPAVLDPWAAHALHEAAHLAAGAPGSRVTLVSLGPRSKLQQVMMAVGQKVAFELLALDGPASGFVDAHETAARLADAVRGLPGLDRSRLLLCGGWESASRGAGATLQLVGEQLEIADQFQGVDAVKVLPGGALEILERVEGGRHLASVCEGPPAVLGFATGSLPEPRNDPKIGMANMRTLMPALQRAAAAPVTSGGVEWLEVALPRQVRETRIVKDLSPEEIAAEIVEWIGRD